MLQATLDSIWRWVIGVGIIPAFIALWFRLTIIESPRYIADVGQDSLKAASELNRYLPPKSKSAAAPNGGVIEEPPVRNDRAEYEASPSPSWEDFKEYFWRQGNLRTLMATSLC
jgi:MFS transporter, PHS family, inorganic phosphate transporter